MSGYILLWKRTLTDPRFGRLVRTLERKFAGERYNLPREFFETLALGCLAKLWLRGDDHVREDDSLDLGADEVDELLGITLIHELLGTNYLEVLDAHHVRLPNYTAHNNLQSRKRAFGNTRQERHRKKNGNAPALQSNALTLHGASHGASPPTSPLPTSSHLSPPVSEGEVRAPSARAARATRLPTDFELTEARRAYGTAQGVADVGREWAKFTDYWRSASGAKARRHDWDATWRNWCRRASEMPGGRAVPKPLRTAEEVEADYKARGLPLE